MLRITDDIAIHVGCNRMIILYFNCIVCTIHLYSGFNFGMCNHIGVCMHNMYSYAFGCAFKGYCNWFTVCCYWSVAADDSDVPLLTVAHYKQYGAEVVTQAVADWLISTNLNPVLLKSIQRYIEGIEKELSQG